MHRSVSNGTQDLPRLEMPMPEATSFQIFRYQYQFQGKCLSVYTPRNLVNETCFIELLSIVRHRGPLKEPNFRPETINMNSVFDLLREIALTVNSFLFHVALLLLLLLLYLYRDICITGIYLFFSVESRPTARLPGKQFQYSFIIRR